MKIKQGEFNRTEGRCHAGLGGQRGAEKRTPECDTAWKGSRGEAPAVSGPEAKSPRDFSPHPCPCHQVLWDPNQK